MKFLLKLRNSTTNSEKSGILEANHFDLDHFHSLAQKKGYDQLEVMRDNEKIWPFTSPEDTKKANPNFKPSNQSRFLETLNEQQSQAVKATQGFVRIIAGAGSGKTKVLANRYAYIVEEFGISPSNILCVTFTNRAAKEMKARIQGLLKRNPVNDFICTYHGFCAKLLREEIYRLQFPLSFIILDEEDQGEILKEVYEKHNISSKDFTYKQAREMIGCYKECNPYVLDLIIPAKEIICPFDMSIREKIVLEYIKIQKRLLALDFNDLLYFAIYILDSYSDTREKWQRRLCYIMVDETQDNSKNQWLLVNILCDKHKNLFVVGDPDQCIYSWRGAIPETFLNFDKSHSPCTTIVLNTNYRSAQQILSVANSIIDYNKERIHKELIANRGNQARVTHIHAKSDIQEAQTVAEIISKRMKSGSLFRHFAILYRATSVSRVFEQAFILAKIPYVVYGGIRFFERKEIKDSLAYLRLIANGDDLSFVRVINTPSRRLGKTFVSRIKDLAKQKGKSYYDTLKDNLDIPEIGKPNAVEFVKFIEDTRSRIRNESISQLLQGVLDRSGLMEEIRKDGETDRMDNIKELMLSITQFEQMNQDEESSQLYKYLQEIALYTNLDMIEDGEFVKFMTIHQAKGLEFDTVFVVGMTEGMMPNYRSIRQFKIRGLEEERRLAYVAVTRAENELYLTESEGFSHETGDKYPSRFIFEVKEGLLQVDGALPMELIDETKRFIHRVDDELLCDPIDSFEVGDMIEHPSFGRGEIVQEIDMEDVYMVRFIMQTEIIPISRNFKGLSLAVTEFPHPLVTSTQQH